MDELGLSGLTGKHPKPAGLALRLFKAKSIDKGSRKKQEEIKKVQISEGKGKTGTEGSVQAGESQVPGPGAKSDFITNLI